MVFKAVDGEKWMTISNFAVLLKACSAMAADIAGDNVLIEVSDLPFEKNFSLENVNDCISRIMEDNGTETQ